MKRISLLGLMMALTLAVAGAVHAQSGGTFQLTWYTVDGGGQMSLGGGTFELSSTAGQPDAAMLTGGTFQLQGGFWNPSSATPLAVTLASFTATTDGRQVLVAWETISEIDNGGFHLYRAKGEGGPWVQLNGSLIPSPNPGATGGNSYQWIDDQVEVGVRYRYRLEAVDVYGVVTSVGETSVAVGNPALQPRLFLPLIRQ